MKLEGDFELIEETLSIVDGTLEVTIKGAPTELTEEQIDLLRSLSLQRILIAGARLCLKKIKEAAYDVNSMGGQDGLR